MTHNPPSLQNNTNQKLREIESQKEGLWVSWNENIKHSFKNYFQVNTEADLQRIISKTDNVRFYGNKQSSADICAGTDVLIDMNQYDKMLSFDNEKKTITVQTGMKLVILLELIEEKGWCIPCLPDINTITIGGAFVTGTHGTSGHILAEYVTSCRLVQASGEVLVVDEDNELIHALRVSLGTLGVLSTLTFQCEELYTLHVKEEPMADSKWLPTIKED